MAEIIKLTNISKSYYGNEVLKDVNLSIQSQSFSVLLGENGAGKSTLLNIIMGIERPSSGAGQILGYDLMQVPDELKKNLGLVSEAIEYDVPISIKEFFNIVKNEYPHWDQALFEKLIFERKIDLKQKFRNYSRGLKMQLCLIFSLSIGAKLILIDEVTSVLDLYARHYFMNELGHYLKRGGTIILTTNIISEVQSYATHLTLLKKGHIFVDSPIKNIPEQFVKLKKLKGTNHPIFEQKKCFLAGNFELFDRYIVDSKIVKDFQIPEAMIDSEKTRLEDLFIYYFNNG